MIFNARKDNDNNQMLQYHSGVDGKTTPAEAYDDAIDMTDSNYNTFKFDLYIPSLANIESSPALTIFLGSFGDYATQLGAEWPENWNNSFTSATVATAIWRFDKDDLKVG